MQVITEPPAARERNPLVRRRARRARLFAVTPTARPWLERRAGECAWPVGEPDVPMRQLSCCAPTDGGAYCAVHARALGRPSRASADDEALIRWLERRRA